jgi:tetratricopeptide (TPR) repeat protein
VYENIGLHLLQRGHRRFAVAWFDRAETAIERMNLEIGEKIARLFKVQFWRMIAKREFAGAYDVVQRCDELSEEKLFVRASLMHFLGSALVQEGLLNDARIALAAGVRYYREAGAIRAVAPLLLELAWCNRALGQWTQAVECFTEYRDLFEDGGTNAAIATALLHLIDCHTAAGDQRNVERRRRELALALALTNPTDRDGAHKEFAATRERWTRIIARQDSVPSSGSSIT